MRGNRVSKIFHLRKIDATPLMHLSVFHHLSFLNVPPFHALVLKPDSNLTLRQPQPCGELFAFDLVDVFMDHELCLQFATLAVCEHGPTKTTTSDTRFTFRS